MARTPNTVSTVKIPVTVPELTAAYLKHIRHHGPYGRTDQEVINHILTRGIEQIMGAGLVPKLRTGRKANTTE